MEDNAFDKLKSMLNTGNIPEELQSLISNMNSSSKSNNSSNENSENDFNNMGIDFETIIKFKTIMDKMNSKDDPRTKLLTSLKPYLKDSRKSKIDQYIQFLNMSKVIEVFSKKNGDDKL